jgi:hypothetical protein
MERWKRDVYTRTRDTVIDRVAQVFDIAPEDLSPDYSPPRDVVVEERLYYDSTIGLCAGSLRVLLERSG